MLQRSKSRFRTSRGREGQLWVSPWNHPVRQLSEGRADLQGMTAISLPEYDKVNSVRVFPGSESATAGFGENRVGKSRLAGLQKTAFRLGSDFRDAQRRDVAFVQRSEERQRPVNCEAAYSKNSSLEAASVLS